MADVENPNERLIIDDIPATMKAVWFESFGDTNQLNYDTQFPTFHLRPNETEVVVQVYATSINPVDWKLLLGYLQVPCYIRLLKSRLRFKFPFIPCFDVSGVVVKVGENCTKFNVGDEVYGMAKHNKCGAAAEYMVIDENLLASKPNNLTHKEAASLPLTALTSYQGLVKYGKIKPGDRILIIGASGGTGTMAIQIAKHFGCLITAVCSKENFDYVRGLGADEVLDYKEKNWWDEFDGYDFDLVFDCIGIPENAQQKARRVLKLNGDFVTIVGDKPRPLTTSNLLKYGWDKMIIPHYYHITTEANGEDLDIITDIVEAGGIIPHISEEFPLSRTKDAFEKIKRGHQRGKNIIVLV